jgi:hypothetical protein
MRFGGLFINLNIGCLLLTLNHLAALENNSRKTISLALSPMSKKLGSVAFLELVWIRPCPILWSILRSDQLALII